MRRGPLLALGLMIAGCSSSRPADEPSLVPPPQPTAQTSQSLEARVADLQTSMTELLERLDVLNARIAKVEAAQPSVGQAISPASPAGLPTPHQAPAPQTPPLRTAQIAETYRHALMLFGQGKHAEARALFQQVFDADPGGQLADNALFWIGEAYYAARDYSSAMRYYERVTKEYADQNKAPDAMFKMALTFEKTGDLGMARSTLEECIRRYPYSAQASSAKLELKRIRY